MKSGVYIIRDVDFAELTEAFIDARSSFASWSEGSEISYIRPLQIQINQGLFYSVRPQTSFPEVTLTRKLRDIVLSCSCRSDGSSLCSHQALVLKYVLQHQDISVFFDEALRTRKLREVAVRYGVHAADAELFNTFGLNYQSGSLQVEPINKGLLPLDEDFDSLSGGSSQVHAEIQDRSKLLVFSEDRFYGRLSASIYTARKNKQGYFTGPLETADLSSLLWAEENTCHLAFYAAVTELNKLNDKLGDEARLKAILKLAENSPGLPLYYHDRSIAENITIRAIIPVKLVCFNKGFELSVKVRGDFYELDGVLSAQGEIPLSALSSRFNTFFEHRGVFYIAQDEKTNALLRYMQQKGGRLLIHYSRFAEFNNKVLSKLPGTRVMLEDEEEEPENSLAERPEKIIYLTESANYVHFEPMVRYHEVEVPIYSDRVLYIADKQGRPKKLIRDSGLERDFSLAFFKVHEQLGEQFEEKSCQYVLHKKHFLNNEWFISAYESWREREIQVYGFNEIAKTNFNTNSAGISIRLLSGVNWFNVEVKVSFGARRASLKKIYKAVKNRQRYVKLDDGSTGILPQEWVRRFEQWFASAEIVEDEVLGIARTKVNELDTLFKREEIDDRAWAEILRVKDKLVNIKLGEEGHVPEAFRGTLRSYQKQGLHWLNSLASLGMGACLADDMGLGKTVQIIAFALQQLELNPRSRILVVVPSSLLFNWQLEFEKFAPSLTVYSFYGAERKQLPEKINTCSVALTTYGTMLSEIGRLKSLSFDIAVFDESQNIKNPGSQRYKAAALIPARVKFVLTGTPIENNIYDLYAQLSIAARGLLGGISYFKQVYADPIESFGDKEREIELQKRISPFVLRRSKKDVLTELPEKIEVLLYCDLEGEQRKIYNDYEKEFRELVNATNEDQIEQNPMHLLRGITRLRQICNSPMLISGEKPNGAASVKLKLLLEQVIERGKDNKILVFSQFVSMLNLVGEELAKHNITYLHLDGKVRNRRGVVEKFQTDDTVRIMLVSLKVGGTGLNLTRADYVYLLEPWWNPAVEEQAIDRAHRMGRDKQVVALRMVCRDTLEERMMEIKEKKRSRADLLINSDAAVPKLNKAELLKLLGTKLC